MQSDFLWGYALLGLAKVSLEKQVTLNWTTTCLSWREQNEKYNVPGCYHTGKLEEFFAGTQRSYLHEGGGFNEPKKKLETSSM